MADDQPTSEQQVYGLADVNVGEATDIIDGLSLADLATAEAEEREGKGRAGVLAAIARRRAEASAPDDPTYSAEELAGAAQERWGVSPDVVRGAFLAAGVTDLPLDKAEELIREYANRPVGVPAAVLASLKAQEVR